VIGRDDGYSIDILALEYVLVVVVCPAVAVAVLVIDQFQSTLSRRVTDITHSHDPGIWKLQKAL
jgi:hypothetical protein